MGLNKNKAWFEALIARAEGKPVDVRAMSPAHMNELESKAADDAGVLPLVMHGAFGKLVQLMRRKHRLTPEQLASKANVDLAELLTIEEDPNSVPSTRTVVLLAKYFEVAPKSLLQLSGHATVDANSEVAKAAVRFAASSKNMDKLTSEERDALNEFVRVLSEQ